MRLLHRLSVASVLALVLTSGCRSTAEPTYPVICHVKTQTELMTVYSTPDGPLYSVKAEDGKTRSSRLTTDELLARHPKLHGMYQSALADNPTSHAPVDASANLFESPPQRGAGELIDRRYE